MEVISFFFSLNGHFIHPLLVDLSPINPFFDPTDCDKSVHDHVTLLADPVNPVHGLVVSRWVPVWIEDDDSVGPDEVQTTAGYSSGQDSHKDIRVLIELPAHIVSLFDLCITVQPEIGEILRVLRDRQDDLL